MKNTKRKGFTIVELVIVIAVIAILAAVLIPTFASLVKKANVSADEQAVKQMNTALAIYTAENGKPETIGEVKIALDKNLINAESLIPVTQGYAFYWNPTDNEIVLVGKDGKITTPESAWLLLSTTGYGTPISISSENVSELATKISGSTNANPALVTLTSDITISEALSIGANNVVVIDLQDKKITVADGSSSQDIFSVRKGTLTIKGEGTNTHLEIGIGRCIHNDGGDVTLQGVNMKNNGSGSSFNGPVVKMDGISNTAIVGCTLESTNYVGIATNSSDDESDGARLSVTDSTIKGKYVGMLISIYANITIDHSTVIGEVEHGAFFRGCNVTISDSKVYCEDTSNLLTKSTGEWKASGNKGPLADITFASGGSEASGFSKYIATGNYVCNNVTAKDGVELTVVVHEPDGGTVNVSGVTPKHICHGKTGTTCTGKDSCTAAKN